MNFDFIYDYQINFIFRIIVAGVCGIFIGMERKNRAKEAGIRTHCIVACAAALMMIISKYGFFDMTMSGDIRLDPSRMAQGIVTGVGFLGAGMIYFQRGTLIGLTTASGIWAVSGIGMAIGSGMYIVGISSTFIILIVQLLFHRKHKLSTQHKIKNYTVLNVCEKNFQYRVTDVLKGMNISITDVSIKKYDGDIYDYVFHIEMEESVNEEDLLSLFDYECSVDFAN